MLSHTIADLRREFFFFYELTNKKERNGLDSKREKRLRDVTAVEVKPGEK